MNPVFPEQTTEPETDDTAAAADADTAELNLDLENLDLTSQDETVLDELDDFIQKNSRTL